MESNFQIFQFSIIVIYIALLYFHKGLLDCLTIIINSLIYPSWRSVKHPRTNVHFRRLEKTSVSILFWSPFHHTYSIHHVLQLSEYSMGVLVTICFIHVKLDAAKHTATVMQHYKRCIDQVFIP